MPKINKLGSEIFNLISAGEVVERPASVVKELVENSIDAGANDISIFIEEGGIQSIKIVDNGCGMDKDNIYLSYLPHATSKLEKASDLDTISTLGFRGEALASIAAVAQLTITSKEMDSISGYSVTVHAGNIISEGEIGCSNGTSIEVKNLFYNTPVRLKFLKKPKQEETMVTSIVTQLMFANSDLKIKYIVDGKIVFQTVGGLQNAIYAIYGTSIANNLIPFDIKYMGYRVYGYTGNSELFKHNKNYQTIIVNGRTIENQNIMVAVNQAYGNMLMKRCFPVYVLNIIMPFEEVDVNVHPTKSDVRFQDNHKVFSAVFRAIQSALETQSKNMIIGQNATNNTNLGFNEHEKNYSKQTNMDLNSIIENKKQMFNNANNSIKEDYSNNPNNSAFSIKSSYAKIDFNLKDNDKNNTSNLEKKTFDSIIPAKLDNLDTNKLSNESSEVLQNNNSNNVLNELNSKNNNDDLNVLDNIIKDKKSNYQINMFDDLNENITAGYRYVGQIFETYLIIESNGKAYLIDQHACHEKFLYENLVKLINDKQIVSQSLLLPFVLQCTSYQYDLMNALEPSLVRLGFGIEEFGDLSFKISEIPNILNGINLQLFFDEVLTDKSLTIDLKAADLILDKLAQRACKSAIKAGDKLNDDQIKKLLGQMKNGIPMQCPHGRPAIMEFTRKDLDKMFKRIV